MIRILAQRIGGSGHACKHLHTDFDKGYIPRLWEGHVLREASLNLVLQAGYVFRTPIDGEATKQYVNESNGETYYLQAIQLFVLHPNTREPKHSAPGLIHRNRPHPREFDNVIEVIAPDLAQFLQDGLKEWFALEGSFEAV